VTARSGELTSGLRWRAYGRNDPVTLVAHGLGATPGEARVPASGLPGTRVVVTLPGHGDAPAAPPGYWRYPTVAADLRRVAEATGATRAVGVSLGAGALTRLVAEAPTAFDRLVLLLPAALDRRSTAAAGAYRRLADAVAAGQADRLRALVAADLPHDVDTGGYVRQRTDALLRLGDALRDLPEQAPLADPDALAAVAAPVLVLGAVGDPMHPEAVAKATAAALPRGRLELLDSPAPLLTHRARVRTSLVEFLTNLAP
jgi:pimeloyl-ACP methyl ester carboxylesterase